ncbi:MAG: DJ-1/PfpI family protein [Dehalococcoidia bacterium]
MTKTIGIVLYPDFEELDAIGPYEVFGMLSGMSGGEWQVVNIAEATGPVRSHSGLKVVADYSFDDAPPLDVVLVPGGLGSRIAVTKQPLIDFVRRSGAAAEWQASVCTGAFILHEAGLLAGKRATTHWGAIDMLRQFRDVQVVDDERYVRDGNVITSAGVSAGIDMALYLVSLLKDPQTAQNVQKMMEYYPKPPTFEKVTA